MFHQKLHCTFEYERVYLPLCKLADTPFHIQRDDILILAPIMIEIILKLPWILRFIQTGTSGQLRSP